MRRIYDIILENWLLIFLTIMFLSVSMTAFHPSGRRNSTIIHIAIDLDKIDGSLKSIEETIDEIFTKLEPKE